MASHGCDGEGPRIADHPLLYAHESELGVEEGTLARADADIVDFRTLKRLNIADLPNIECLKERLRAAPLDASPAHVGALASPGVTESLNSQPLINSTSEA